jgi:hypothetical protein
VKIVIWFIYYLKILCVEVRWRRPASVNSTVRRYLACLETHVAIKNEFKAEADQKNDTAQRFRVTIGPTSQFDVDRSNNLEYESKTI